ncbi:GtrA family protein [Humibacillus xanthopallidus]|uniref:GtrA family protein n=1 Tax=Humibacillus xanthopallidus TaxID=412689 RepID=UPI0038511C04
MAAPRIQLSQQVIRFAGVGLVTTALHLGLFAALVRGGVGSQLANGVALVVATLVNTGINRAWTFGVSGRRRLAIHHGQALVIFAITYAATTLALALLGVVAPGASTMVQTGVVLVANVVSTAARFVAMRSWIFTEPGAALAETTAGANSAPATVPGPTDRHDPAYGDARVLGSAPSPE